jgi:hypothetical protein
MPDLFTAIESAAKAAQKALIPTDASTTFLNPDQIEALKNARIPQNPFSSSLYDSEDLRFPLNLGSNDINYYVCFFINETKWRKLNTGENNIDDKTRPVQMDTSGLFQPVMWNIEEGGAPKMFVDSTMNDNLRNSGSSAPQLNRFTIRLDKLIALYMPPEIIAKYIQDWSSEELRLSGDIVQGLLTEGGFHNQLGVIGQATFHSLITDVLKGVDTWLNYKGANNWATASVTSRLAFNPHLEVIYKGPNFRKFRFSFKFIPDSEKEADVVRNIIKNFKYYAAPSINTSLVGRFWIYPAEFDIVFYARGEENNFINKISTCVLTNIEVNYTPSGQFVPFRYSSNLKGATTVTILNMEFTEVELMTRQRIKQGY